MHICFVVEGYPTNEDPFMPFIRNTVSEIAKQGIKCSVIAPQSISRAIAHHLPIRKTKWIDHVNNNISIDIYQPYYMTLSGKCGKLNRKLFEYAAKSAYVHIAQNIDVMYGHFWHMGVVASKLDNSKPIIVACGESKISVVNNYSQVEIKVLQEKLAGVIYVSTKSYTESCNLKLQQKNPYIVLPNAIDDSCFNKKNRTSIRTKLGWDQSKFVVCFVGAFVDRKGVLRLDEALQKLNNQDIYACFIGSGEQNPKYSRIYFKGKLPHEAIVEYLSASDVFVLPTTNEGCCNAIVEALACGLPIISSKDSFNDDILNQNNSIRIDSLNVDEISNAINELFFDRGKCNDLSRGSIKRVEKLTLANRAKDIIEFIKVNVCDGIKV